MATARSSTNYANIFTNKYVTSKRIAGDGTIKIPFEATIVSISATGDTYNLCVIPANARVVGAFAVSEAMGASAGTACTIEIGDSGDVDRYIDGWDADALNATAHLAAAGMNYEPTADTIVVATITNVAVVGKVFKGWIEVIPAG